MAKSRLAAERASLSSGQREHVLPIEFSSLSGAVREVFATVVDGGTVSTCPTKTATGTPERALSDALDLVEKRIDRQRGRYDGAGPTPEWVSHVAYLRRGDQYYVLSARLSDVAVSYGTPPQSAASGTDTASP